MSESLIQLLIREDFGDTCAMVANLILQNGELSLIDIIAQTKLPFDEIKNVLVVLIKHNIIIFLNKANPPNVDQAAGPSDLIEDFVYRVSVKDVLYRLRFAKILHHIGTIYGGLVQTVMEQFIENGRLTVSDILAEIEEHKNPEIIGEYSEKEILEAIATLIKGQYLVQVEKVSHSSNMYSSGIEIQHTKPGFGGKSSKRKPAVALKESTVSKNRRAKKTKTNPLDEINLLASNGLTKDIFARIGQISGKEGVVLNENREVEINRTNPREIQEEYNRTSGLFFDGGTNEEYIFRINNRKLVHDFRTSAIVDVVKSRFNIQSSWIIQAILRDSQLFSKASSFKLSEGYTLGEIMERLASQTVLNESSVDKYLLLLKNEKFIQETKNPNPKIILPTYCVDMNYLVHKIQMKTLEKIIEDKHGQLHARVFRILDKLGYSTEKQISDIGIMPIKQARSCIMELIAARIVDSQENLTIEGKPDQIYGLRPQQATANLVEEIHKTLFNLKKRQEVERNKLDTLTEMYAEPEKIEATQLLIQKLESAAIELDDTLMLFCEF